MIQEKVFEIIADFKGLLQKFADLENELKKKYPEWKGITGFEKIDLNLPIETSDVVDFAEYTKPKKSNSDYAGEPIIEGSGTIAVHKYDVVITDPYSPVNGRRLSKHDFYIVKDSETNTVTVKIRKEAMESVVAKDYELKRANDAVERAMTNQTKTN